MLSALQFVVEIAGSGEEAIHRVVECDKEDPFGLILLDWRLPGIDGITTARMLRLDPRISNLGPIILMSASGGGAEERKAAINAGAIEFLPKPLTPSSIVDALLRIYAPEMVAALKQGAAESSREQRLAGARYLLVEDNDINQQIAQELIAHVGGEVTIACNGRQALEILARAGAAFDVVLMDIQMPEMDGYETTRRI